MCLCLIIAEHVPESVYVNKYVFIMQLVGRYLSTVQPAYRYVRYNVTPQWLAVGELLCKAIWQSSPNMRIGM